MPGWLIASLAIGAIWLIFAGLAGAGWVHMIQCGGTQFNED